ncbi:hypothetical protein QJS83_05625 [Bdellovibrio sp. 22V]|uniref:hypothetical protein n=1 Tax=Bdellovibrio sp. 22V TaxID=3044166 RepID=UPI002542BB96|nr:hypothetical protein [Bdellovibrio sp. 22V]WII73348.1 hypothetical protein QJS83_05625 [Bdellovibrio sp. 22V]
MTAVEKGPTPVISIADATTLAKGAVQVGAGIAVSAGTITADPANFPSAVPVSKGGTGSTGLTANRLLVSNASGSAIIPFNCSVGQLVTFDASGIMGCTSYSSSGMFANGGNSFAAAAVLGTNDSNTLAFETAGTTRMTILTDGKVGIGTATPGYRLDVLSTSTAGALNASIRGQAPNLSLPFSTSENAGVYGETSANYWPGGFSSNVSAVRGEADCSINSNSSCDGIYGGYFSVENTSTQTNNNFKYGAGVFADAFINSAAGTVTTVDGMSTRVRNTGGTVTTARGLNVKTPTNTGTVSEYVGINIETSDGVTGLTGNYAFKYNGPRAFVIESNGEVGLGTTAPSTALEVVDTTATASRGISSTQYSSVNPGGLIQTRGARGTASAPTALQTNDSYGWYAFNGYNGSAFTAQAQPPGINAIATENWSTTGHGTSLRIVTTPNGATNGQERIRVDQNGNVGINTAAPTAKLEVAGDAKVTGNLYGAVKDTSGNALRSCVGTSNNTGWVYYAVDVGGTGNCGAYLDVNTSACGFTSIFNYFTTLHAGGSHWASYGATSVYSATPTGFRVYVNLMGNWTSTCNTTGPLPHNNFNFAIKWMGVGQ